MEIYNSDYSVIMQQPRDNLLISSWKSRSSELDEDGVKKEMLMLLDNTREFHPTGILADTREFYFDIDQKMQDWIVKHLISEIIELGVHKYAIVVTEDSYKYLSRELIEEETFDNFSIQYFTDHEKALAWLKKDRADS
ncbi:MAG: hypothetical protein ACOCW8_02150 [bacterium]